MVYAWRCCVIGAALLAAGGLCAQTVYKSVDEKGNVTYSESPPAKGKTGKIRSTTELSIDPNRNIMPAQQPASFPPREAGQEAVTDGEVTREERIAQAKAALDAAEQQLKAGADVQPGDFIGRAGGGVGPSPQRLQRLQDLQRAVDEARDNLERAQSQ